MAISTIEQSLDSAGLLTQTTTEQSFSTIQLPEFGGNLRGARLTIGEGQWTLVKEEYLTNGSPVYSADANTSTEPIESHPYCDSIKTTTDFKNWNLWKANPDDPKLAGWAPDQTGVDDKVKQLYEWYKQGITTYLAPRIVIKHSTIEDAFPDMSFVGQIAAPGQTGGWDGNFICTGINVQQEGGKYRVTVEYMGSAQGKTWDSIIYAYGP
jgi:hypothetical protein